MSQDRLVDVFEGVLFEVVRQFVRNGHRINNFGRIRLFEWFTYSLRQPCLIIPFHEVEDRDVAARWHSILSYTCAPIGAVPECVRQQERWAYVRIATGEGDPLGFIEPMQPTLVDDPPAGADWCHEVKWDGYRTQIVIQHGASQVFTRRGND